ncbi:MAG: ABC transporter permease subunit/CPBP intramembrane protease [bacterium]
MARLSEIRIVYAKEIRDAVRDRRTLFAMVLLPMLIYPLFVSGSSHIFKSQEKRLQSQPVVVGVEGDFRPILGVAAGDTLLRFARLPESCVEAGDADAWVFLPPGLGATEESLTVRLVYDGSDERSSVARGKLEVALDSLRVQLRGERLRTHGIDRAAISFGNVETTNIATAERMTGARLGSLVPFLLILFLFSSGSYVALDAFAGERERGTLEPLLATSAARESIVAGKFLAILTVNLAAAFLNLGSLIATLSTSALAGALDPGFRPTLSAWSVPLIMLLSIPLAVLATSVLIVIAASARTFREGQYLAFPVLITAIVPAMAGNYPGIEEVWPIYFVPVANVAVVTKLALVGEFTPWRIIAALVTTSLFALAGLSRASRVLSDEASLSSGRVESPAAAESSSRVRAVFFFVAVDFLLFFHIGILLQSEALYLGLAAGLIFLVLAPSLVFLKVAGMPIAETVRWRAPSWRAALGAVLLAPAVSLIAQLIFHLTSLVIPAPEELLKAFADLADEGSHGALATYTVLALVPGVCEEFLFRGVVFGVLSREWGAGRAAVASGVLFAAFHLSVYRLLPVLVVGVIAAVIVWKSGSLIAAMILHVAYNAVSLAQARELEGIVSQGVLIAIGVACGIAGTALLATASKSKSASKPRKGARIRHSLLDSEMGSP